MLFKHMYPHPLNVPTQTRDSNIYMLTTLRIAGVNLDGNYSLPIMLWRAISFSYGMCYLPLSFMLNFVIYFDEFSPATLLQSLQLCLNTFCFSLKFLTLTVCVERLKDANCRLDDLDTFCVTVEEQRRIRTTVAKCNKLYMLFSVVCFLYATSSLIDGLCNGLVPFNTYYPFVNWRVNKTQFFVQAVVEYLTVGYAILVDTSTDSYGVCYVEALRQHVLLLKERVQGLGSGSNDDTKNYADLVRCIEAHKVMLNLCEIIRPLISKTIFAQFIICGSILGITCINLVAFAEGSARFGIIFYMMAVLLQTFPLCYYCNCLVDDSQDLADAVFHSSWVNQNQRYKKTALQFLQKLQQPMTFTAMNIFNVNLATNINVGKFAFTVYAIAKGMNLEEKLRKKD